ncbi:MAG: winged helix-turn-helix transcriptional regulator [Anaerolineales bacterium]|nr:winged helix-turn-helix transcriptional regulator [Anaerolineales bacterium]
MAPLINDFIEAPPHTNIRIELAPVPNALFSLMYLTKQEHLSGPGSWVTRVTEALLPEEKIEHYRIMIGFFYAIQPDRQWSSFPAYLDHLESLEPVSLRDKMLRSYTELTCIEGSGDSDWAEILKDSDRYLDFLYDRFPKEKIDADLEIWAYSYVIDPPAMQKMIVCHLRKMWDQYLEDEWNRIRLTLEKAVEAFQQVDYSQMSKYEAAEYITGHKLEENIWEHKGLKDDNLVFVPSMHVGPYIGTFWDKDVTYVIFGARLPENANINVSALGQADIYARLNTLADETRLRIIKYIADNDESCSPEIMQALDLSQSAASRHLNQLSATGYLLSRRADGAKCYRLNPERIEQTLEAIRVFLLDRQA